MIAEHNLHHYQALTRRMRAAIVENRYSEMERELRAAWGA